MSSTAESLRVAAENYLLEESLLNNCSDAVGRDLHLKQLAEARESLRREVQKGLPSAAPNPFTRVVVALDGSPEAKEGLRLAIDIAKGSGGRLLLTSIADTRWKDGGEESLLADIEMRQALLAQAEALLLESVKQVPTGIPMERVLAEGEPASEIVSSATHWGADLIVMGTRGRGRIRTALLGSTAQKVLHRAVCPVMAVTPAAATRGGGAAAEAVAARPSGSVRPVRQDVLQEETE